MLLDKGVHLVHIVVYYDVQPLLDRVVLRDLLCGERLGHDDGGAVRRVLRSGRRLSVAWSTRRERGDRGQQREASDSGVGESGRNAIFLG